MLVKLLFILCTVRIIQAGFLDWFNSIDTNGTETLNRTSENEKNVHRSREDENDELIYEDKGEDKLLRRKTVQQHQRKYKIPDVHGFGETLHTFKFRNKPKKHGHKKKLFLNVQDPILNVSTPAPTSSSANTIWLSNEISSFTPTTSTFTTTTISTFPTCSDGTIDNGLFCEDQLRMFECHDGLKVNKSLRCNRKNDCFDGSDELNCEFWPPKITLLPARKVELFCATDDTDHFDMLTLECEFVGPPEPLIKWKKYEGHVPSKCQQISINGRGILKCPNFKQLDQGAYSCVAENFVGSSESQPRSIVKCKNLIPCNGFRVKNDEDIEHCLECYCSGKSDKCQGIKSKPTVSEIPFPNTLINISANENGEIVFIPSQKLVPPSGQTKLQKIKYCELGEDSLGDNSLLKSYGRNMRIPKYTGKVNFLPRAPDIIMQGNGLSLYYMFNVLSPSTNVVDVKFWPGNWHHLNMTTASREDLMTVLSRVDRFLFRCQYKKNEYESWKNTFIHLESSFITDSFSSVSYVEKCSCPEGYVGLSCESCAQGYERKHENSSFICKKIQCDSKNGFFLSGSECVKSPCSINGSVSLFPDFFGKCKCKEGFTGDHCNKTVTCPPGYFSADKSTNCLKCWCSGVTDKCNSSNLHLTEISSFSLGGYNSSNGRNFWLLPHIFSGNKLTSYGGNIKYSMKYIPGIPKQTGPLSVELLTVNEVTLTFTNSNIDKTTSESEKTWAVPLKESYWNKADKTRANRSEFLNVLTTLKAIYVESPYHLSSGKVNLTWVRMSDAKLLDKGTELASEVEQCLCPSGYTGLSCEYCAQGFYRKKNTNQCIKCECDNCDPEEGCMECPIGFYQEKSANKKKPICKPCECNGREIKCGKDDHNNTYCICKSGFTGLHCENAVMSAQNSSHLTITISPSKLTNNVIGTVTLFNCSYDGEEKLKLSFKKTYHDRSEGPFAGVPLLFTPEKNKSKGFISFNTSLDEDLVQVECLVHNMKGQEVGRVLAVIESTEALQPVKITNCYSSTTIVKETKNKDFICQVTGYPKPMTVWYAQKPNMVREKVESIDGVHSIEAVKLHDNNTIYTCEAENIAGDKDICSITLIVEKNCDVVHITPKWLIIEEGEAIHLMCRSTANNTISWSRVGAFLPLFRTSENNGNLTINNAAIEDSGNYTCKTTSSDGKNINQTVSVTVREKLIPPTVYILKNDTIINSEEDFEVVCSAKGKPFPSITWKKMNENLGTNVLVSKGTLKIKSATLNNSGLYQCEVNSKAGSDVGRIFIEVKEKKVPPELKIVPSSLALVEGQETRLQCTVLKGSPRPKLSWFKDTNGEFVKYKDGDSIEFLNISRYDSGIYQCRGHNSAGKDEKFSEVDVMFAPEITVSQNEIEVYENDEITVKCKAVGNPRPQLMWKSELKSYKRNIKNNDILADLYLTSSEVAITIKVSSELKGLICVATNEAGKTTKEIPVRVLPEFIVEEKDAQLVPIGSYHEMLCEGCSGKLVWENSNGRLFGDECEIPRGLMIPSVQIQHNTTYVCKCDSDPRFKKKFTIIVDGFVPKFTQEPKSYLVLPAVLKSKADIDIEISFKVNKDNGLLLKDDSNILILYVNMNKVAVTLHSEHKKKYHFVSTINLKHNVWYTLVARISSVYAKLTIYDANSSVLEEKLEQFKDFGKNIFPRLFNNFFVGGSPRNSKNVFLHSNHIPSMDGCISRLIIDNRSFNLIREGSYSSNVYLCKRCSEIPNPCRNEGMCLDAPTQFGFLCICPDVQGLLETKTCPPSCIGRGCESQVDLCEIVNPCHRKDLNFCSSKVSSLSCRCGLGYSGLTCEREEQNGFCVKGDGYVKLPPKFLDRSSWLEPEVIEIRFSLEKPSGLLLWQGDMYNHILIDVINGQASYTYLNQGYKLQVVASNSISLNNNHTIIARRMNGTVTLYVDSQAYTNYSKFTTNRAVGNIFLGGAPRIILPHHIMTEGLTGCIHYVAFGNGPKVNFRENVVETLNTKQYKPGIVLDLAKESDYDRSISESDDDEENSIDTF